MTLTIDLAALLNRSTDIWPRNLLDPDESHWPSGVVRESPPIEEWIEYPKSLHEIPPHLMAACAERGCRIDWYYEPGWSDLGLRHVQVVGDRVAERWLYVADVQIKMAVDPGAFLREKWITWIRRTHQETDAQRRRAGGE